MAGNWTSGSFMFPTSTGSFAVTGLPFEPQGLFFIGTNFAAEDVLVTDADAGIFFGSVWTNIDTGLPDSQSVSLIMQHGINVKPHPIIMAATLGCDVDYAASFVSFDASGFTLNVTNAASADRPITWMAYGSFTGAVGKVLDNDPFFAGFRPASGFAYNYRTTGRIRDGCESGSYTSLYLGGNSWPSIDEPPTYQSRYWGSGGTSRFVVTGLQGFTKVVSNITPSPQRQTAINISTGDFPPIVLEDRIQLWRETGVDQTIVDAAIGGGPLLSFAHILSAEASVDSCSIVSTEGGVEDYASLNDFLTEIEAGMYISVLGTNVEGLGTSSRMGIGFITPDAQGCVAANRSGHGFQSTQYGACSRADAAGITVAHGVIDHDIVHWTTEIATAGISSSGTMIVWGGEGGWIPQMYRRWPY